MSFRCRTKLTRIWIKVKSDKKNWCIWQSSRKEATVSRVLSRKFKSFFWHNVILLMKRTTFTKSVIAKKISNTFSRIISNVSWILLSPIFYSFILSFLDIPKQWFSCKISCKTYWVNMMLFWWTPIIGMS